MIRRSDVAEKRSYKKKEERSEYDKRKYVLIRVKIIEGEVKMGALYIYHNCNAVQEPKHFALYI